ncbi:MAG TPA: SPOR domain-containing protein [Lentimicrobium sp.]|nr:SPOR domain-containing protein [Lentimicrobium sp.]
MKTLAKQISELLFVHDCVIVPGLGGFITIYKPAHINPHHHTFYPPSKLVTFNAALSQNDGILINAYAGKQGLTFNEAKSAIEEKIQNIRISLIKGKKVEFEPIGYLVNNKENNIEFHPSNTVNYLGDAYGLTKFSFSPVDRSTVTKRALNRPAVRKTMRWAAVMLPLAAVAVWATFNAGSLNNLYNNYASLIPAHREEVSAIKAKTASPEVSDPATVSEEPLTDVTRCISPSAVESTTYVFSQPEALSTNGTVRTIPTRLEKKTVNPKVNENYNQAGAITYYIIAGAFGIEENALKLVNQLKAEGYNAELLGQNKRKLHLVSIKSLGDRSSALKELQAVHHSGYSSAWMLEKAN